LETLTFTSCHRLFSLSVLESHSIRTVEAKAVECSAGNGIGRAMN
jgi:hypothetical protein